MKLSDILFQELPPITKKEILDNWNKPMTTQSQIDEPKMTTQDLAHHSKRAILMVAGFCLLIVLYGALSWLLEVVK